MSYRGLFNVQAGRGYGDYFPRANRDIRVAGGIVEQGRQFIEGMGDILSGEFKPGPDGGHHRSTGRPAGDHNHGGDRYSRRRDQPRDTRWQDDIVQNRGSRDEPVRARRDEPRGTRWQNEIAPQRRGAEAVPSQARAIDTSDNNYFRRYMSQEAIDAVDALPKEGTVDAFNRLDLPLKQEITRGITRQNADRGTGGPVTLDANGNLDMASVARSLGQPVPTASAPAISAVRTLTPEELDAASRTPLAAAVPPVTAPPVDRATALGQAIGIDQLRAQNDAQAASSSQVNPLTAPVVSSAATGTVNVTVTVPTRPTFDVRTLTTDTDLTSGELNRMSAAGISMMQMKLGQAPDAPKLMTDASGKIVGGYSVITEGNAKSDATYRFSTREDLETKFGKEMVSGIEQGLKVSADSTGVAASNKPAETPAATADTGAKSNLALNMTANTGGFNV